MNWTLYKLQIGSLLCRGDTIWSFVFLWPVMILEITTWSCLGGEQLSSQKIHFLLLLATLLHEDFYFVVSDSFGSLSWAEKCRSRRQAVGVMVDGRWVSCFFSRFIGFFISDYANVAEDPGYSDRIIPFDWLAAEYNWQFRIMGSCAHYTIYNCIMSTILHAI